jgi:hypothetical protein
MTSYRHLIEVSVKLSTEIVPGPYTYAAFLKRDGGVAQTSYAVGISPQPT